ncbi:unnamed protein product [Hymenolepis diminuta]|uniref:Uncharacterized protein n=1 Tax=Hymenolepis diminuta TaxID=6216 RepID=A0A564Z4X9_HYMDI|nr:unnamed protein product [Hymenolepis diminuta]
MLQNGQKEGEEKEVVSKQYRKQTLSERQRMKIFLQNQRRIQCFSQNIRSKRFKPKESKRTSPTKRERSWKP